jgi:hypothetical protein
VLFKKGTKLYVSDDADMYTLDELNADFDSFTNNELFYEVTLLRKVSVNNNIVIKEVK